MRFGARALIGGFGAVALAAAAAVAPAPAMASGGPHWAPASKAKIRPGVPVTMAGVKCVAGFFLTDGTRVFISIPTSCSGVTDGAATDGCVAAQVPVGTTAKIAGARYKGHFVYSSDTAMQLRSTSSKAKCENNSLALIRLDPRDIKRANPSVIGTGGPTGVAGTAPSQGAALTVSLAGVATPATYLQTSAKGWAHSISVTGSAGALQLGSPVMNGSGRALGLLTLVQQSTSPPESVSDLSREITFLQTVRGFGNVHLAKGTRPFVAA
jgi:hypothetical protein